MYTKKHCSVCIRRCENGNSFCHRRDMDGHLIQENRFCAISVDTLIDKPIVNFRKNAKVLSIGSWGCNFRCLGCQNTNLSWSETGESLRFRALTPLEVVDLALKNSCEGICYTYNEPAILLETVEKIAIKAREKGLFNVFVTNSTLTENSVKRIARNIDVVASDIKSLNDEFYYVFCGAKGIHKIAEKVLKCIRAFSDAGSHVEVRTNIIPGGNDQEENYHNIASWIRKNLGMDTPWHITRFFPAHKLSNISATSEETLFKAQQAGIEEGLKFVYIYSGKGCDCAKEKCLDNNLINYAAI